MIVKDVAEGGVVLDAGKAQANLTVTAVSAGYLAVSIFHCTGPSSGSVIVTVMLEVKGLWKSPPFCNWIPAELCHYINVFSDVYVLELGVLDLSECFSRVLLTNCSVEKMWSQLLQLGCAAALAVAAASWHFL